jgi:hypothetical protein
MRPTSTNAGERSADQSKVDLGVAVAVRCDDRRLHVTLSNGKVVSAALADFPTLASATRRQRANAVIEAFGTSIHWPDVDEDIGVSQLLGVSEEALYRFAGFTSHT